MKKVLLFFLFLCIANISVYSQDFEYLEKIQLKSDSDFIKHEKTVLECVDFLSINRVDQAHNNRVYCNRFLYEYGTKTPFVTIGVESYVVKLFKKNGSLLSMYFGYWLKAAIQNKDKAKDGKFCEEYTVNEIYQYCKGNNGVERTKIIESLIQAGDKSQLKEWLAQQKK
ncbi:MAG TPA: hypothetical protein VNZ49_06955 [Bacteroidia bacterium]|jgi:hypothetical protein|nr:hypothetical protein [Bacteroidia bacterium]